MDSRSVPLQLLLLPFEIHNSRSDAEAGLLTEARLGNAALFLSEHIWCQFSSRGPAPQPFSPRAAAEAAASPSLCHQQPPRLPCLLSTQRSPALASRRDCKANNNELQSK